MSLKKVFAVAEKFQKKLAQEVSDLPEDFEKRLEHHRKMKASSPEYYTEGGVASNALLDLSENNPDTWAEIGHMYKGWKPHHVAELLKKL
jgi:hypothetical protein